MHFCAAYMSILIHALNRSDESSKIFVEFNKADILEGKTQLLPWNIVFSECTILPERTNQFLLVSVLLFID